MSKKNSAILHEQTIDEIQQDRRANRRYALNLPVHFKVMKDYLVLGTGTGTTSDMSSKGVAFTTTQPPKVGSYLELSVNWPVLLNDSCPMKLMIYGCVVRSNEKGAAVAIERYEFRTQGSRAFQQTPTQYEVRVSN